MKKILSVILSLLMILSVLVAAPVTANAKVSGGYEYRVLEDGTAEITEYGGSATKLTIPSALVGYAVTSIGDEAFWCCTSLTSVTIPDSVTSIGDSAFFGCTSLTSVTIPNSVTSIGRYAFSHCTSLTSVTIPDSVTSIGRRAFFGCTSLSNISVDSNNTAYCSIDGNLYNKDASVLIQYAIGKTAGSFTIPNSITEIGDSAFEDCTSLESVTIPNSVTSIGDDAFRGCTSLTSVTIPDSVTSIGDSAFFGCTSLTSVTIPNSVTSIGRYAFAYRTSLTSVTIPDSVTSIGYFAFSGCTSLSNISVDSNNTAYCSIDGNLYNKDASVLIQYAIGKTAGSFTIPNSVTEIGDSAFSRCTSLTSVAIPDSVTSIRDDAFSGCTSLTSVAIPDSVTSIGGWAFADCTSLTSVTIPNSVTSIESYAFGYYYDESYRIDKVNGFTIYGYKGSEAERYADEEGFTFIDLENLPTEIILTDEDTGISVVADSGVMLSVAAVDDIDIDIDGDIAAVYNITLTKDGEPVQPKSAVTVKIPSTNPNAKVYRVEADSTLTDMNAVYEDGCLVFTTDHFSIYLVAEPTEPTEAPTAEPTEAPHILGDTDGDGKVTIVDVTCIQKRLASIEMPVYIEEAADVDGDGKVTIVDATFIQKFLASMTAPEGIGEPIK